MGQFVEKTFNGWMKTAGNDDIMTFGGSSPVCPGCGNNNALLGRICLNQGKLTCRDCGVVVSPSIDLNMRYFSLSKAGKGKDSLYVENY